MGLWIKKSHICDSKSFGIVTTLAKIPDPSEGIVIRCRDTANEIQYRVSIYPDSESSLGMTLGSGSYVWFYSTMVWSVGSPVKIYEDGQFADNGDWTTGITYVTENTKRELVFGSLYTDDIAGHALAYVDGVRMFNRPLGSSEVEDLYVTFTDTETTTALTTDIALADVNETGITELNMELTGNFTGDAVLTPLYQKVIHGFCLNAGMQR